MREQKRVAACLTGRDGRFSFAGLKPGRYLLRAGTRAHDQFNEVHVILILDPRGTDKGMEIVLTPGT
jgi:protocatechuate 3,4-dioxygenase beta subunit